MLQASFFRYRDISITHFLERKKAYAYWSASVSLPWYASPLLSRLEHIYICQLGYNEKVAHGDIRKYYGSFRRYLYYQLQIRAAFLFSADVTVSLCSSR